MMTFLVTITSHVNYPFKWCQPRLSLFLLCSWSRISLFRNIFGVFCEKNHFVLSFSSFLRGQGRSRGLFSQGAHPAKSILPHRYKNCFHAQEGTCRLQYSKLRQKIVNSHVINWRDEIDFARCLLARARRPSSNFRQKRKRNVFLKLNCILSKITN